MDSESGSESESMSQRSVQAGGGGCQVRVHFTLPYCSEGVAIVKLQSF